MKNVTRGQVGQPRRGARGPVDGRSLESENEYRGAYVKTKMGRGIFKTPGGVIEVGDEFFRGVAPSLVSGSYGTGFRDGELEVALTLGFFHKPGSTLVLEARVRYLPVDDGALEAAADHVCYLASYLLRVVGAVADIAMVRISEPGNVAGVQARL